MNPFLKSLDGTKKQQQYLSHWVMSGKYMPLANDVLDAITAMQRL